jgi:hypothetical protein
MVYTTLSFVFLSGITAFGQRIGEMFFDFYILYIGNAYARNCRNEMGYVRVFAIVAISTFYIRYRWIGLIN